MEGYTKVQLLGEGAFGKCYLYERPEDGHKCVVKQIDISSMSPHERREAYHEATIMNTFDHPFIIRFRQVYTTPSGQLNIVMDYADGGDLQTKIKNQQGQLLSENSILEIFVQICLALKHVHDRKVLHRDLKGQNIFLHRDGTVKLGDFGIARVLSSTIDKAQTMIGTPYYLSPEIIENKPYSFASDIWALGVLLYELVALHPPFDALSIHSLALKIVRGIYAPLPAQYSHDLKTLIETMLSVEALSRPTIREILKLPFLKGYVKKFTGKSRPPRAKPRSGIKRQKSRNGLETPRGVLNRGQRVMTPEHRVPHHQPPRLQRKGSEFDLKQPGKQCMKSPRYHRGHSRHRSHDIADSDYLLNDVVYKITPKQSKLQESEDSWGDEDEETPSRGQVNSRVCRALSAEYDPPENPFEVSDNPLNYPSFEEFLDSTTASAVFEEFLKDQIGSDAFTQTYSQIKKLKVLGSEEVFTEVRSLVPAKIRRFLPLLESLLFIEKLSQSD